MYCPTISTIDLIVKIMERHGSLQNVGFCGTKRRFTDSVADYSDLTGDLFLFYNTLDDDSTHTTRIKK